MGHKQKSTMTPHTSLRFYITYTWIILLLIRGQGNAQCYFSIIHSEINYPQSNWFNSSLEGNFQPSIGSCCFPTCRKSPLYMHTVDQRCDLIAEAGFRGHGGPLLTAHMSKGKTAPVLKASSIQSRLLLPFVDKTIPFIQSVMITWRE